VYSIQNNGKILSNRFGAGEKVKITSVSLRWGIVVIRQEFKEPT